MTNNTRRQHYVWRSYLSAWEVDGKLWCRRDGKVFTTSAKNVANARDLYRLRELSEDDINAIRLLSSRITDPVLRQLATGWLPSFTFIFHLKRIYEARGRRDLEIEQELEVQINTLEEGIHSEIEGDVVTVVDELRQGNLAVLDDDDNFASFARFIAMQHLRTPFMIGRMTKALLEFPQLKCNVDAVMGPLRAIYSTTMGAGIFYRRALSQITLVDAPSGARFIAGDHPLVNLRAVALSDEPPAELEIYYPLTPSLALILDLSGQCVGRGRRTISADDVRKYNGIIASIALEQVYAADKADLEPDRA